MSESCYPSVVGALNVKFSEYFFTFLKILDIQRSRAFHIYADQLRSKWIVCAPEVKGVG